MGKWPNKTESESGFFHGWRVLPEEATSNSFFQEWKWSTKLRLFIARLELIDVDCLIVWDVFQGVWLGPMTSYGESLFDPAAKDIWRSCQTKVGVSSFVRETCSQRPRWWFICFRVLSVEWTFATHKKNNGCSSFGNIYPAIRSIAGCPHQGLGEVGSAQATVAGWRGGKETWHGLGPRLVAHLPRL